MQALNQQLSGAGKVTSASGAGDMAISSVGGVAAQVGDRYVNVFGAKDAAGNIAIAAALH